MRRLIPGALLVLSLPLFAQDGPPGSYGPTDPHQITPTGGGQKVLVIYVQANDFRIPPAQLAGLNTAEDGKRAAFPPWFGEMSWNNMTMTADGQRTAGSNWYVLPKGLLEYVRPGGISPMQVRAAGSQTAVNPTPASAVAAAAGGAGSNFTASDAGNYWYAVTAFRNGSESSMTKIPAAVAVAAGQSVTLTITRATADSDRYLIYRTSAGATNADGSFSRIGQIDVAGAATNFIDNGIKMDALGDWAGLIGAAIEAAHSDVNYDNYRGVAVVIFSPFLRGQASFGTNTFTFTGGSINTQGTFMSSSTGFGRFTHEMGHWLALPDLYDPSTGGSISTWDTMDCACDGQYYAWEKDYSLHYLASPANVVEVTRPAPGSPDLDQDFIIEPTEVADTFASRLTAIKIKSSDTVHYYVEGRAIVAGKQSDQNITDQRVVVIEGIDTLPSSILPQRNVTLLTTLASGDPTFQPEPGGNVQITFNSINAGTPPTYNVHVKMRALPQPDPKITPWNAPPWESPDIWVDSAREGGGFMDPATATPLPGNGEHAWVNHVNRVWAKITNVGQGAATNVKVHFKVATPGGMGDTGQYAPLPDPMPIDLNPGEAKFVFTTWTPTVGQHTCIKVEIERILGEADIYNNQGQENVTDFYSGSASPWHPVPIPIVIANPFDSEKRIDVRVEGLPTGWRADIDHMWVTLASKARTTVNLVVTPKPDAPQCTSVTLNVYGVVLLDDYIQPYGGITPIIHLANPITFRWSAKPDDQRGGFIIDGCTAPPKPNSEIALILSDSAGHDTVVFTRTDGSGCFHQPVNVPPTGAWTLRPYFRGDDCNAPTEGDPRPLDPSGSTGNGDGNNPFGGLGDGKGRREIGIFTGGNWPIGRTRRELDPGFLFGVDLLAAISQRVRLALQAAYHQFDEKNVNSANVGVTNLSLLANVRQPWGPYRLFVAGGAGIYRFSGSAHPGVQLGGGIEVPVSGSAYLLAGFALHAVSGGTPHDPRWIDGYLGFRFGIP